ncbi:hypothetical protein EXE43_23000 [Halorubrum sp. SS5]|nr:hypothetical protein [Halorubrum sp. SS7]TKX58875.1 hypothetical protein EXE44_04850 [Halorubrum sp. SS7]TKX61848.1 hypothetical protein EXE45_17115 [Halorubrum sp. SP9]TKX83678.1 hypothetical protein EXE43_23000 [Halorubrum sp. SS5]
MIPWLAGGYVVGAALTFIFLMILVEDRRAENVYFWRIIALTVLWPFLWVFLIGWLSAKIFGGELP